MALKYIRDNLKSFFWVLWIVVAALVGLVFFEWGGFSSSATAAQDVAVEIGDETVTFKEFENSYRSLENQYKQTFGDQFNEELAKQLNLPHQALNQVIERRILLREAREIGLQVTDKEVQNAILEFPVFQKDGRFIGVEEYQKILLRNRLSPDDFEASMREDLLLSKLQNILAGTAYVSDEEVRRAYKDQVERAKIRYVELAATDMGEVTVETADLAAYLEENAEDYKRPEQRVVEYLLVDNGRLRGQVTVEEADARAYYDANPTEFQSQEQVTARHILRKTDERSEDEARAQVEDAKRRIEAGEDFAAVAQELSEDPGSAARGGSLGAFGRGQMLPPFEQAAFNAEVGTLVGPVQTSFGFHLIEVQGHSEAGLQPFEEARARIDARLKNDKVQEEAERKIFELAGNLKPEDDLQALADADEAVTLATSEPFGEQDVIPGFGRAPDFNAAVFQLEEGALTEPLRVPRGWAIARLKEIHEPRDATLEEVEDEVRRAVTAQRQKEAARARLEELAGQPLDDVAATLGLEVKESTPFGPNGNVPGIVDSGDLAEAAFKLEVGDLGGPLTAGSGAIVFEVVERETFDPEKFEEEKEATRAQLERQRLIEIRSSLVELRRRETPPRYSPALSENFGIGAEASSS